MDRRTELVIPWQGLITSDGSHHMRRGGHPLLDKIYTNSVSYLTDPTAVCSRIRSHSGYATLPRYCNILYQSFMPNCKLSVEILRRYYRVSREVISFILSGSNMRMCNQRLLTFILTEFDKDYDILRFCAVVEQLIQLPELRRIADKLRNAFPIKPKEDISPVTYSENTSTPEVLAADKKEFGAECLQSGSIKDTEDVVKEALASRVQSIPIQRKRNQTLLVDDYPVVSEDFVPVVHENVSGLSSLDATIPTRTNDRSDMLDSFTQDTSSLYSPSSSLTAFDELSEEVKHKPIHATKPIEFLRSHSSETSSPAKSPSCLSPDKDHHSLSSYSKSPHLTSPLTDQPLLEHASPAAHTKEMTVTLQPSPPPTGLSAAAASFSGAMITPTALLESKGFEPLKSRYNKLYQNFPGNYMDTVSKLERHLTDNEITEILNASGAILANKKILDSLIMHMKCREDLLDLCDQLEKISGSADMYNIIKDLRNDVVKNIQKETVVHSSSQVEKSGSHEPEPTVFSQLRFIDPNSKVMKILKNYYTTLYHSLPADYGKCVNVLSQSGYCYNQELTKELKACGSSLKARQYILDYLIECIDSEEAVLDICDTIDAMVEDEMKHYIESFRNEILAVLSSKPQGSAQDKVVKKKFMIMSVMPGSDLNQFSELTGSIMDSKDAKHTTPDVNISQPPSIPQYYVRRAALEKELSDAVLNSHHDKAEAVVTVTVNGDAGFGKSTLTKAFCHSEDAKGYFTSGFVLIELGPNASNPLYKLMRLYKLLSRGHQLDGSDVNSMIQHFHSMVVKNYSRILVIIDDVCKIQDAQPFVTAFRSCKIIVTTKSEDVTKQFSSCKVVTVGPMEPSEATKLLSDIPVQIAEDDERIVDELVTDLYHWPLLISLARGQFQVGQSKIQSIGDLQANLYGEGLEHIAYNTDVTQGKKVAITACIEVSLQLLEDANEHDRLVNLVHQSGVGGVISFHQVTRLWNLPEGDCVQLLTKLDSMGLVVFAHPAAGNAKATVKVHSVISQYLMDSQVYNPPGHMHDSHDRLSYPEEQDSSMVSFLFLSHKGSKVQSSSSEKVLGASPQMILNTTLHTICEHNTPRYMNYIKSQGISWGTLIVSIVENLYGIITNSPPNTFPNSASLARTADRLSSQCQSAMIEYPQEMEQLIESTKIYLNDKNYDKATEVLEQYFANNFLKRLGLQAKALADQVYLNCDQFSKRQKLCEFLFCFTPEHDYGLNLHLPQMMLMVNLHRRVTTALASGPATMETIAEEMLTKSVAEQSDLINANYMIKLQEVAPHYVSLHADACPHMCIHACTKV